MKNGHSLAQDMIDRRLQEIEDQRKVCRYYIDL